MAAHYSFLNEERRLERSWLISPNRQVDRAASTKSCTAVAQQRCTQVVGGALLVQLRHSAPHTLVQMCFQSNDLWRHER